ncbi:uncharacterized protein BX664DRAFT_331615 [Halteromyces radiatus]|uniref:uncharacterized protein n=1 Tax=Halteromyces radiatus TaxID=101107 RepID=UPI00221EB9FC|nr:uncharacterized protein BX664DRAFT_331615 [Halteromyces radiatus]KAI8088868.1 hypothetical protein BX664DRAFT_331615 [Halteromyces radiatus]
MSPSHATYLPRWSNQLTEQLLSYRSTPTPPPFPQTTTVMNDSGTASVTHDDPKQEIPQQQQQQTPQITPRSSSTAAATMESSIEETVPLSQPQKHNNNEKEGNHLPVEKNIPALWAQLSHQLPIDKKRIHKLYEEEEEEVEDDKIKYVGLILFWLGFLCPLLWCIGGCIPRHPDRRGKLAHRWQIINRLMALGFGILLTLLLIAIGIWYHLSV